MSRAVVIVDYGMGNVMSVRRGLDHCGADTRLTDRPDEIAAAERLVLPGVGAFADCMRALESRGLVDPLKAFVATGRPFLGICVGMQILLEIGEEFGGYGGLGLIAGRVSEIDRQCPDGSPRKIPHIGWTPIAPPASAGDNRWTGSILDGSAPGTAFYFVHSFTAVPSDPADVLATADYAGAAITAAVQRDNITGVQFHPEKSGAAGLALLDRFIGAASSRVGGRQ